MICCLLILFLAPLLRTLAYLYEPAIYGEMQLSLLFMGDAIAIGCLLALLSTELENSPIVRRIINLRCFSVIPILSVVMYTALKLFPAFYFAVGEPIALLCIAATLWKVMHVRDTAFGLLNSKPLVKIGVLSYSLYVWQQLFVNPTSPSVLSRLPLNLFLVCAATTFSYFWIELPFLRLRPRLLIWLQPPQTERQCTTVRIRITTGNV